MNKEINAVLADRKIEARIIELGNIVFSGSPSDFGEAEKWGKVIRAANIKPE